MRKKFIAVFTAFITVISCIGVKAGIISERVTETPITRGVTQYITERFTDKGWYTIYTIKADLNEEFVSLDTLTSKKGVNTRDNTLALAKESGAIAAVNADFFQPSGSNATRASALGAVIRNGKMLTTPARGKSMATVAVSNENIISMGLWDQYINLIAPDGEVQQVFHTNKYYDDGALIIYDRGWDEYSPGAPVTSMEMVVEDNIVTEIRTYQEGVLIPENGYIVATTSSEDTFFTDHFKVGDEVKIDTWIEPNPEHYKTAVGGGTLLLKDGENAPVTHNISGTHPRTAMGTDKTGKIAYLVAVDGRQASSIGMTLDELRNYMRELGCYNAINFDGGGSTTFVTKAPYEDDITVKNSPSDGSLRRVANGIGIISSAPVGSPAMIEIISGDKSFYSQSSHKLSVNVYDEYYHKLQANPKEIIFSVSGVDGYIDDGVFYPRQSGTAKITAKYKSFEATIEKYVRPSKQEPETDIMKLAPDEATEGTKIAVVGYTGYNNLLGKLYSLRTMSKVNKEADAICMLDKTNKAITHRATVPIVFGEYYYAAYKKDSLIIQLNNTVDGLRKSEDGQWGRLIAQLDNLSVNNVIFTLSQPPTAEGFGDSMELKLFKQTLEEKLVDKGKNVFVVYDDVSNSVKIENGIRYFGLKGIKDVTTANFSSLTECKYLLITSDGDKVVYQLKSILEL